MASLNIGIMAGLAPPPSLNIPDVSASAPTSRLPTPPPVKRRNAHSVPVSPKGTKKKLLSPISSTKSPKSPIVKSLLERSPKNNRRAVKKPAPCLFHSSSSVHSTSTTVSQLMPSQFDQKKAYGGKETLGSMRGQFGGLMYDVRAPPIKGTPLFGSGARFDREKAYEGKETLGSMRGSFGPGLYTIPRPTITGTPSFGSGARFDREKAYEGRETTATMRGRFGPGMYDVACSKTGSPLWKARGTPSAAFGPRYSDPTSTLRSASLRKSGSLPAIARTGSIVNATIKPRTLKPLPKLVPLSEDSAHVTPPHIIAPKAMQVDDSGSPREIETLELERPQSPCVA